MRCACSEGPYPSNFTEYVRTSAALAASDFGGAPRQRWPSLQMRSADDASKQRSNKQHCRPCFRSSARALSDRLFADKASLARFPVYLGGFRFPPSSNLIHPRLGGLEMDEAKPMIVPKLVAVTKADWRTPAKRRSCAELILAPSAQSIEFRTA